MIVFTYSIADFLSNAQIISMYRASANVQAKGELPIDDSSITNDDNAILTKYLNIASSFIAANLSGYAKELFDIDGITPVSPFETTDTNIIFRINTPATFKNSVIPLLDESIKDAIENYLLYRVSKHKGHDWESFLDDHNAAIGNILLYLNQRTKTVTRKYNLF